MPEPRSRYLHGAPPLILLQDKEKPEQGPVNSLHDSQIQRWAFWMSLLSPSIQNKSFCPLVQHSQ